LRQSASISPTFLFAKNGTQWKRDLVFIAIGEFHADLAWSIWVLAFLKQLKNEDLAEVD
jgi:hypothetical protein